MNKKLVRVLSILLSSMVFFGCVLTVSAEETETPVVETIKVSVRVEGLTKTLADKEVEVDKSSTVKSIIDAARLDVVYGDDGTTIKSVKSESTATTSVWQYAVGGSIRPEAIDAYTVEEKTEIVLFNASYDAVMPSFNADEVALSGVIIFMGTDKAGTIAPISGATITWETKNGNVTYKTDADGKIYITQDNLAVGKHTVKISKVNASNVPTVVRFDAGTEVEVNEVDSDNTGNKTVFEQVYDFLYAILKGVVDVWIFYIKTIIGLFK